MRIASLIAVAASVCGLLPGCSGDKPAANKPPNKPVTTAPADFADFQARLNAGLAINDISKRSSALATVAEDAAAAGMSEVVKKALQGINDITTRNRAAATAALKLAGAGQRADATEVTNLINDISLRNETLSRLAKGESE